MPVSWEIRGSLLILTLSGDCGDEVVAAIARAVRHPDFPPGKAVLFDARLATGHATSYDAQRRAAQIVSLCSEGVARRCAIVVGTRPYQYGLARMTAAYLDFEGMEMQIFKAMEPAIDWLERPAEQTRAAGG
ncbi:MAG TPA: hypothetical protein VKV17_05000 [Bryobacteraceae bacterium]|nr:hypothetical protein [Bryobacteraceae bacterium]